MSGGVGGGVEARRIPGAWNNSAALVVNTVVTTERERFRKPVTEVER